MFCTLFLAFNESFAQINNIVRNVQQTFLRVSVEGRVVSIKWSHLFLCYNNVQCPLCGRVLLCVIFYIYLCTNIQPFFFISITGQIIWEQRSCNSCMYWKRKENDITIRPCNCLYWRVLYLCSNSPSKRESNEKYFSIINPNDV